MYRRRERPCEVGRVCGWTARYGGVRILPGPRPHARSAAARQEKTRGRRRISRKAPDLPHDAVRAGAESDERLHTGTTSPEGHSGPSMGKGQLGPFAQSSPPGSHWGICGVVEDYSIAGIQLVTGCNRLGPRNRTSTGDKCHRFAL